METTEKKKIIIVGVIIGVLLLVIVGLGIALKKKSDTLKISEQNVKALTDTLTTVRLRNNEIMVYRNSLVISNKTLEEYLKVSKEERNELEKRLNAELLYISKIEGRVETDTIVMETRRQCLDSTGYCRYAFEDSTQYYTIGGYMDIDSNEVGTVTVTENSMDVALKVGLDDEWKIFVTSDNPNVKIRNVEGALLDKDVYLKQQKKSRWGLGVQVGFGGQYDIIHRQFGVGPYVGIGLSYNFVVW